MSRPTEPRNASSSMQAAIATMQKNALTNHACASIRRRSYQRGKPRRAMLSTGSMVSFGVDGLHRDILCRVRLAGLLARRPAAELRPRHPGHGDRRAEDFQPGE